MTALQWIVKEAKSIKKAYPNRFAKWTDYVKQASAIYASKHKTKSQVGKKKAAHKKVGNVTLKKSNRFVNDDRYIIMNDGKEHLQGKAFSKTIAKEIANSLKKVKAKRKIASKKIGVVKKAAPKKAAKKVIKKHTHYGKVKAHTRRVNGVTKKPSEKDVLKSIKHAVKVQESHMSMGTINSNYIKELSNFNNEIEIAKKHILALRNFKKQDAKYFKEGHKQELLDRYINRVRYLKLQISQAKKHIK